MERDALRKKIMSNLCQCGCEELARNRFVFGHHGRKKGLPFRINKETGCWEWIRNKAHGYGRIRLARKDYLAHRIFYTMFRGSIPVGKQIDHLCRNRGCVHPLHLDVVTNAENIHRGNGAKLNWFLVQKLRASYTGKYGQVTTWKRQFGISVDTLRKMLFGHTWREE